MTKIFTLSFCLGILGLFSFTKSQTNYTLEVKKVFLKKDKNLTYYVVPVTLTNLSNDTLNYFSMSCSWQDIYLVNNPNLSIQTNNCDKNIPTILTILPRKKETVKLNLLLKNPTNKGGFKFKIGLNLIEIKNQQDILGIKKNKDQSKLLWSNEVTISK